MELSYGVVAEYEVAVYAAADVLVERTAGSVDVSVLLWYVS